MRPVQLESLYMWLADVKHTRHVEDRLKLTLTLALRLVKRAGTAMVSQQAIQLLYRKKIPIQALRDSCAARGVAHAECAKQQILVEMLVGDFFR